MSNIKEYINVYDFDDTIYEGDSTVDFYKYCIRHYPKVMSKWPKLLGYGSLFGLNIVDKTKFKEKFYEFLTVIPDIDEAVGSFWKKNKKNLKEWYLMQKDESDLISSASPAFLLDPICKELEVRLIASLVDPHTGLYTGLNNKGEEKVKRLNKEYPDIEIVEFYSDSLSDAPLAKLAQRAFIVKGNIIKDWPSK